MFRSASECKDKKLSKLFPTRWLVKFVNACQGAVAIYIAALLPILIGGGLLVVDGARLYNLQTLLQKGADAMALAAARELDGCPAGACAAPDSSITRADSAIANLVKNKHTFGGGVADVTVSRVRYLSGLPADDSIPIPESLVTTDPAIAQFVEVTVTPTNLNTIFPASFLGGTDVAKTGASAIAGLNEVVCEFTPMFICNPFEGTGLSILDVINNSALKRRLINMRMQGGGTGQYSPGNYGFLEPDGNPGADALRDMMAMSNPPTCFSRNGVTLRPGFVATVRDAVNVRFDLYEGPLNSKKGDVQFRPAQNVRKGYEGPDCNQAPDDDVPPDSRKLDRDWCFADMNCPNMGGRMGDGRWDFNGYWDTNFPGRPRPTDPSGTPYDCAAPPGNCPGPIPSRHDIYQYEISAGLTTLPSVGGEVGNPRCSSVSPTPDPDRRHLFGAVLNCQALGIDGGRAGPYPVLAFVKFFITEPVLAGANQDIFAEIVDVFTPGDGAGIVRDEVQLYR